MSTYVLLYKSDNAPGAFVLNLCLFFSRWKEGHINSCSRTIVVFDRSNNICLSAFNMIYVRMYVRSSPGDGRATTESSAA